MSPAPAPVTAACNAPGAFGTVITIAASEYAPSPEAFVARTRNQYRVFAERPLLVMLVLGAEICAICVQPLGTPELSPARSTL